MAENSLVYLARGNLYTKSKDGSTVQIKSQFMEEFLNRISYSNQKDKWKENKNSPFLYNLWNNSHNTGSRANVKITGACRGSSEDEIYYAVETDDGVGALLHYNILSKTEKRIIHQHSFSISGLNRNPATGDIICSIRNDDGSSSITIIKEASVKTKTEGQSLDEYPYWVPDTTDEVLYQSAGIAFDNNGIPVGLGNYALHKLNLSSGTISTILDNRNYDFLFPKQDSSGNLYFIKRPYDISIYLKKPGILNLAADIVLFPFRLLRAVFHFLNTMSMIFSSKPLSTAGGTGSEVKANIKEIFLNGKVVNVEKALKNNKNGSIFSIVPDTWELIKLDINRKPSILAKGVVNFDIFEDKIIFTNGMAVYTLNSEGDKNLIDKNTLIESVYSL